jgi:hypothetical protein
MTGYKEKDVFIAVCLMSYVCDVTLSKINSQFVFFVGRGFDGVAVRCSKEVGD